MFAINPFPIDEKWLLLGDADETSFKAFIEAPIIYGKAYANLSNHFEPQKMHNTILKNEKITFKFELLKPVDIKDVNLLIDSGYNSRKIHPDSTTMKNQSVTVEYKFKHTGFYDVHFFIKDDLISTYTFKVKAANNDGVWNDVGTALTIIKQPAFWQTWWFQLASLMSIGLVLIIAIKLYTQNIRNRNLTLKSYNENLYKEIEERKRIEKALENREQFLKLIMDSVPQFIFWLDTDFRFLGGNRNLLRLLNIESEEDLIGKNGTDLNLAPDQVTVQEKLIKEVIL